MNNFTRITSKDNDLIKHITSLQKSSKKRKENGVFILEGERLCNDAVLNGYVPNTVVLSDTAVSRYCDDVKRLSGICDAIYSLPDSLFSKISDTANPQGILCIYPIPSFGGLSLKTDGRYIALENLQDPANFGAISRTAEAFGIDGIIMQGGCDPYSPKSLRASMGALLRIPIYQTDSITELFKSQKIKTYAAVVSDDAKSLSTIKFECGSAIVIGNEANGISENTAKCCDCRLTIPMVGKAESLNASVAAAILMWEMCKC